LKTGRIETERFAINSGRCVMRCGNVIRELSAPTGEPRSAILVDHLARCSSCARWAERNARLDEIWDATRPPELSAAAWDRLWANVSESLDRPQGASSPAPVTVPGSPMGRPWHRSAMAAFALAQAAAILACFGLAWHHAPTRGPSRPVSVASTPGAGSPVPVVDLPAFEVSQDQFALISLDHGSIRNLERVESPNGIDPLFYGFNAIEAQAELQ